MKNLGGNTKSPVNSRLKRGSAILSSVTTSRTVYILQGLASNPTPPRPSESTVALLHKLRIENTVSHLHTFNFFYTYCSMRSCWNKIPQYDLKCFGIANSVELSKFKFESISFWIILELYFSNNIIKKFITLRC